MCTKKRGNRYCTLFVPSYMAILSWRLSCWFLQDKRCRRENFRWYEEREVKWSCTVKGAIWCLRNERFACPLHWRLHQTCPGASWWKNQRLPALVFPAKFFEIGGTNVLSTIDSGHGKKLKLFVFPSSCLNSLPVEICTNCEITEICKTRLEASNI